MYEWLYLTEKSLLMLSIMHCHGQYIIVELIKSKPLRKLTVFPSIQFRQCVSNQFYESDDVVMIAVFSTDNTCKGRQETSIENIFEVDKWWIIRIMWIHFCLMSHRQWTNSKSPHFGCWLILCFRRYFDACDWRKFLDRYLIYRYISYREAHKERRPPPLPSFRCVENSSSTERA